MDTCKAKSGVQTHLNSSAVTVKFKLKHLTVGTTAGVQRAPWRPGSQVSFRERIVGEGPHKYRGKMCMCVTCRLSSDSVTPTDRGRCGSDS